MNTRTKLMVESAVMIAIATVLSFVKVWQMPLGGSITLLSMLPIAAISMKNGLKWGLETAFIYSLIQLGLDISAVMSWGLTSQILFGTIFFDYIFAFTALGLAGIFKKHGSKGMCLGVFMVMTLKFLFHFISGIVFFGTWAQEGWNIAVYSLCYNGAYMLPEAILTVTATFALSKIPQTKSLLGIK